MTPRSAAFVTRDLLAPAACAPATVKPLDAFDFELVTDPQISPGGRC
jgi:hypothetical protein